MSRGKKLLIVTLVLAIGFSLAWPFRKTSEHQGVDSISSVPLAQANRSLRVAAPQPFQERPQLSSPDAQVAAKMTSTSDNSSAKGKSAPIATFDLAHHPALAATGKMAGTSAGNSQASSPVTPPVPPTAKSSRSNYRPAETQSFHGGSRPAYATTRDGRADEALRQRPKQVRHVVQSSDTLEKLAKRYLGDENRALEIFDLNRDVLDNPHLLPIGAELRLPSDAKVSFD